MNFEEITLADIYKFHVVLSITENILVHT